MDRIGTGFTHCHAPPSNQRQSAGSAYGESKGSRPPGDKPVVLRPGMAVRVPAGKPHVIENMGRQQKVSLLQVFSPPGPEQVFRNPRDPDARKSFEVIRDPRRLKLEDYAGWDVALANVPDDPGGPGTKPLFARNSDPAAGKAGADTWRLTLRSGRAFKALNGLPRDNIFYIEKGAGVLKVGAEEIPFTGPCGLHLPAAQPFSLVPGRESLVGYRFQAPGRVKSGADPGTRLETQP